MNLELNIWIILIISILNNIVLPEKPNPKIYAGIGANSPSKACNIHFINKYTTFSRENLSIISYYPKNREKANNKIIF